MSYRFRPWPALRSKTVCNDVLNDNGEMVIIIYFLFIKISKVLFSSVSPFKISGVN